MTFDIIQQNGETLYAYHIPASLGALYGVLRLPETENAVPLIILSHGFGSNHTGVDNHASYFADHGFATFNLDFCGGGAGSQSDGTMLEMSVLTEVADLNAVIDCFRDDPRFSRIFLWGASQGGFVSSYVAAQRTDDIAALLMEYPAYVLQDDARARALPDGSFPETSDIMGRLISRKYNEDAISFDIYDIIPNYTGDTLILHGDSDRIVPLSYSERAIQVMPHAELIVMLGQDHGFQGEAKQQAMERELRFFGEHGT